MTDPSAPLPTSTDPVPTVPPSFAGRTPSKTSAVRAGVVLAAALVVAVGAAVALGASSGQTTVGAGPVAAASGSPEPDKGPGGHGFGHGGFGGLGPFAGGFGAGPGNGKAEKGFGRGGGVTITAIDGSRLALATEDGWTRTITLGATTTITKGGAPAKAGDLHVGDTIRFRQHREDDGAFTITAIDVVLPRVVGTITSVAGDTLTLLDRDGKTVTVHLAATTRIQVRGVENGTAKDLANGQVALVVGEKRSDGSIDATGVLSGTLRGPKGDGPKGPKDQRPNGAPSASPQAG